MNLFEIILLNIIYITFPLSFYLFYVAYNKNHGKLERNLFLDLSLYTSAYLIFRFGQGVFGETSIIFTNVLVLIAYIKNRKLSAITLSIVLSLETSQVYEINILYPLVEYLVYYISYHIATKRKYKESNFILYFLALKSLAYFFITANHTIAPWDYGTEQIGYLIQVLNLYVISLFSILMFQKGEEVLKYHHTLKELEQQKQFRDSLFKITHEIKNPIAVCKGYLDMFDVNNLDHSRRYVPVLKEEIARTLILLQDFLSMTKIRVDKDIMDIGMLIEDVMESFSSMLYEHDIDYDVDLSDKDIYINGDYNRLCQVFINIIKNSLEAFGKDSKNKITVNLIEEKDKIKITIGDNGMGISPENLKKIKEPFFTTKMNGTGLGVSLSYEIVEQHGGKIEYESELGFGTKVTVILPKIKED